MLSTLRRVLSFEMTIAEWIGTAVMLAVPYLVIGALWSLTHSGDFAHTHGLNQAVSVLGRSSGGRCSSLRRCAWRDAR